MASYANLTEQICCQNELEIVERKTYIKGHHVYKDVWTPAVGEVLQVEMESKGYSYSQCSAKIVGSRCNLVDGEGMQVPCELHIVGEKRFVERLKEELSKLKEL